jgi:hypothetical protein
MDGTVAGASAAAAGRRVASIGQKFASSGYELPHEGQTFIRDPSLGNAAIVSFYLWNCKSGTREAGTVGARP